MLDLVLFCEVDFGLKFVVDFFVIVFCLSEVSVEDIVFFRFVVCLFGVEVIFSCLGSWYGNSFG